MTETAIRILLIEDNPGDAKLIESYLAHRSRTSPERPNFNLVHELDLSKGLSQLKKGHFDIILLDLNLPDCHGMDTFARVRVEAPDIPIVVLTGVDDEKMAIQALQVGAQDYLVKGMVDWGLLSRAVHYAIERQRAIQDLRDYAQKLWASETRFKKIIEVNSDGMVILSHDSRILFLNPAAEKLLGIQLEGAQGNQFGYPVHAGESTEIRLQHDGKQPYIVDMRVVQTKWEGQTAFLAVMHDITERKRAEDALRESEERFRSVTETAAEAIVSTNSNLGILYWNLTAVDMFGYEKSEVQEKPITILLPENQISDLMSAISKFQTAEAKNILGKPLKLHGIRKDNTEFPLELSLATWVSGEEVFYSAIIRDMTNAHKAQRRNQLQDRLVAVGQLAAGIAHDFNNILGTIILFSESLLGRHNLSEDDLERITMILDQAKRGAMLTSQILDFSRQSIMEPQPIDLLAFIEDFKRLLSRTITASISLVIDPHDEKLYVNADPTRLQSAFLNLSLNARDAMPEGGELRFELSTYELGRDEEPPIETMSVGEWICVRISDTGIGIPPVNLERLFEPFFTTKKPGKGTGLGLAQVYGIVKQHDGFIKVESDVGRGTTFTIYLPAENDFEVVEFTPEAVITSDGREETLLVVDDDFSTRQVLIDVLSSLKYQVISAADGWEALDIFNQRSEEIDLVLSDMVMPEMDGRELYRKLKEKSPEVKILLITGYPLGKGTQQLLDHRKVAWLQKPLTTKTLTRSIRAMLDGMPDEVVKQTGRLG